MLHTDTCDRRWMGLVRVELHHEHHYKLIHEAMEDVGFSRTIRGSSGRHFDLPTGTYWMDADLSSGQLRQLAESAIKTTDAHPPVMIIATAGSSSWSGLPASKKRKK